MRSVFALKLWVGYLIFDLVIPHILYLFGKCKWQKVSFEQFNFYFIPFTKAYKDKEQIIKKYQHNYQKLNTILQYKADDKQIEIYCFPSQALSLRVNKRRLNFVRLNENKIFIIYNHLQAASVRHELVHVMTYDYFGSIDSSVKRAFFEGIAIAFTHLTKVDAMFLKQRGNCHYKIRDVLELKAPNSIFYNYMGSLVFYIMGKFGMDKLLLCCKEGNFEDHFGMTFESLEQEWINHLERIDKVRRKPVADI